MDFGSERSERIIVLCCSEVSLWYTGRHEMNIFDKKKINLFLSFCLWSPIVFFYFSEILEEKTPTEWSSYKSESISCTEFFYDPIENNFPVAISSILLIRHSWIIHLSSLLHPFSSHWNTVIFFGHIFPWFGITGYITFLKKIHIGAIIEKRITTMDKN